jgi:hypothetical protein
MKFEEIEKMVIAKKILDHSVSFETTVCYLALRSLYHDFYRGYITKEIAVKERVNLKKQYRHISFLRDRYTAAMAQYQEFIRDAKRYRPDILKALEERTDANQLIDMMIDCIGSMCHDPVFVKTAKRLLEEIK